MRTTLTLEPDVAEKLRLRMAREKISLKRAVNEALRSGLAKAESKPKVKFKVEPHAFNFRPGVDLDKLNQLVDELEVEEFRRKLLK
jgi:plasmid stability protein